MTDWATMLASMLVGDAVDSAVEKATIETKIEIAKNLLKEGIGISSIIKSTGLEELIVRQLKIELDKESA